ncbi:MAG: AHH domain-containing protein [Brevundimonas sp.]|jgi:hypothetical protein|nr:AHH domain-containing protein [Brevundimonas sp.]
MTGPPAGNRSWLSFRAVNRRDQTGYNAGLQRHHILPLQLLRQAGTLGLFRALGRERLRFDDFRSNGLLLPANDHSALRIGLPLHRGPHNRYNQLVSERVGQIEAAWSSARRTAPEAALVDALARLELLQRALRRRLLDQRRRLQLNRRDPLGSGTDFTELDALVAELWPATADE